MPLPTKAWKYVERQANSFQTIDPNNLSPTPVIRHGLDPLSPSERASAIYIHLREFDYGIDEAVKSGTRFRYPPQIRKQLTCGEAGVYAYMLAQYAGLNPRLFRLTEMDGIPADHFFVDVEVDGERHALDPLMRKTGRVEYKLGELVIADKPVEIKGIDVMDESDIVHFADHMNSRDGLFSYLAVRQSLRESKGKHGVMDQFVSYSPEKGFSVDNMWFGLPSWITINSFSDDGTRVTLGRDASWGEVRTPFYVLEMPQGSVERKSVVYPENLYDGLETELASILAYWIAVLGIKKTSRMDSTYIRTPEEIARVRSSIERDSEYEGNRQYLDSIKGLESINPEFVKRYEDYMAFSNIDFETFWDGEVRRKVFGTETPSVHQMLDKLEDALLEQNMQQTIDFYIANETIMRLKHMVGKDQIVPA